MDDLCKCVLTGKHWLYSGRGIVGSTMCVNLDIPSLKGGQGVRWALKAEEPEVLPGY